MNTRTKKPATNNQITLKTRDGLTLHGEHHLAPPAPRATLILLHGFTSNIYDKNFGALAQKLSRPDMDQIIYDTRGHGQSEGDATFGRKEHMDIEAAVALALEREAPILLAGVSAGAGSIVHYLSKRDYPKQVAGYMLISSPAIWKGRPSIASLYMAYITQTSAGRKRLKNQHGVSIERPIGFPASPIDLVGDLNLPAAIVGGTEDKLFGTVAAKRLYENANFPKRLELAIGAGHGPSQSLQIGVDRAFDWLLQTAL